MRKIEKSAETGAGKEKEKHREEKKDERGLNLKKETNEREVQSSILIYRGSDFKFSGRVLFVFPEEKKKDFSSFLPLSLSLFILFPHAI